MLADTMGRSSSLSQLRNVSIGAVLVLLVVYATLVHEHKTVTTVQAAYAMAIIFLGALPGVAALLSRHSTGLIPLVPLHGVFYALTFGLPVFSSKTIWLAGSEGSIDDALLLTIYGLTCLYLGYYAPRTFFSKTKPIGVRDVSSKMQIRVAWLMYGFYMLMHIAPVLKTLPSVDQLSAPMGYMSLGILALLAFRGQLPRLHLIMFSVATLLTLIFSTLTGSLAATVLFLVFFGMLYWNVKRSVPWILIVATVLFALIFNPVKQQYREYTWYSPEASSLSYYGKLLLFGRITVDYYSGETVLQKISEDKSTINRLAHISTFDYVITQTPAVVPYWMGDSYRTLWTSFIPRIIWPDKPKATIGQEFGHRYRFLAPTDFRTSMNLPWLVEFYANFGTLGVLGGMFFVGVFFRFLVQKLSAPVSSPIKHVLAVTIMFSLFYAESNFSLMVGGMLTTYIAFLVLVRILSAIFSANKPLRTQQAP